MPDYRKFPVERPAEGSRLVIRGEFGIPTEAFGGYRKKSGGVIVCEGKVIDSNHRVWWRYANKQNVESYHGKCTEKFHGEQRSD